MNLNESQRAMVAANLANMNAGDFRGNQYVDRANLPEATSNAEAAQMRTVTCKNCGFMFGINARLGISEVAACRLCMMEAFG